jgi:MFS family permease
MLRSWIVIISPSLFFFYEFLQMAVFNSISQALMQTFDISAQQFGILSAGYFCANVLFLFPAGLALDRFSTRKLIIYGLSLCIIGTIAMAFASNFYFALLARFLIGMSSTLCFLSVARLTTRWFPLHSSALAIGVAVTIAMLGGFIAQTPMTLLVAEVGWRKALLIDAVLGVIFLWIIFKTVYHFPPHYQLKHEKNLHQLTLW